MDGEINSGGASDSNRVENIDVLKGIGILFMVLGHMHFSKTFNHYVYAFHMPLFFLISGYLYKKPALLKQAIWRKAKSLLIPYFSFGIGYWILWVALHGKEAENLFAPLRELLFNGIDGLMYESALWFLPTLFVAYISFALIDKKITGFAYKTVIVFLLSFVGCITTRIIYTVENVGGGIAVQGCLYSDISS